VTSGPRLRVSTVLLILACGGVGCGKEEANPDCDTARQTWAPNDGLGQSCAVGSYGSCTQSFDTCAEGVCRFSSSANDEICTATCTSSATCGGWYCKDGICQPPCSSHTYCDEFYCCNYAQSATDPTICVQTNCWYL
jgi:hypothetical protein